MIINIDAQKQAAEKLRGMIRVKCTDTLLTHLKQIILFRHQEKVCGFLLNGNGRIWLSSDTWAGAFYAVVSVKLLKTEGYTKIVLSSYMNSFGLLLVIMINIPLIYFFTVHITSLPRPSSGWIGMRNIGEIILIGCVNIVPLINYITTRKALIEEIEEKLA